MSIISATPTPVTSEKKELPLHLQSRQAKAAKTPSLFASFIASVLPNYFGREVKKRLAYISQFVYVPHRNIFLPDNHYSYFSESNLFPLSIPFEECYLLELEIPSVGSLIAKVSKDYYKKCEMHSDQLVRVYYQVGRFDGVPKLYPKESLSEPPSSHLLQGDYV
ncbi:MAG: hypothetical protein WD335_02920 [Candidatus Paceibacterota bacterium]